MFILYAQSVQRERFWHCRRTEIFLMSIRSQYAITSDHLGPSRSFCDYLRPSQPIQDYITPTFIISPHLHPNLRPLKTILDYLKLYQIISDDLAPPTHGETLLLQIRCFFSHCENGPCPPPSVLRNNVADFSTWRFKSAYKRLQRQYLAQQCKNVWTKCQIYLKFATILPLKIFLCQFYVVKRSSQLLKSAT